MRRVRALINRGHQLANKADARLDQSKLLLDLAQALVEDLQDGFAVELHIDENALKQMLSILAGKPGKVPAKISIDPTWDTLPSKIAEFKGGPYDGKKYTIPEQQTELVLKGNHTYTWNGHFFVYDNKPPK